MDMCRCLQYIRSNSISLAACVYILLIIIAYYVCPHLPLVIPAQLESFKWLSCFDNGTNFAFILLHSMGFVFVSGLGWERFCFEVEYHSMLCVESSLSAVNK